MTQPHSIESQNMSQGATDTISGSSTSTQAKIHQPEQSQSTIHSQSNKKKSSKKLIFVGLGVVLFFALLGVGVASYSALKAPTPTPTPEPVKKRVVEPANVIPVAERPLVFLKPEADGRNLTLQVVALNKPATTAEYELEYQSGELLQGVNGSLDLSTMPATTTQLMGTCSAGGKCSYHENVQGGKLQLRFLGAENYLLSQEWRYIDNKAKETAISSRDAKFQLSSDALKPVRFIIVYNSPGLPGGLEGTPVSDIYTLQASVSLKGEAELSIRSNDEGATAIAVWDGAEWSIVDGTVDGKTITATVPLAPVYVAVGR